MLMLSHTATGKESSRYLVEALNSFKAAPSWWKSV